MHESSEEHTVSEIGLTNTEAARIRMKSGPNIFATKRAGSVVRAFLKWLLSPVTLMFIVTLVATWLLDERLEFTLILVLFALNTAVTVFLEYKADHAIKSLQKHLTVATETLREGAWLLLDSTELVPEDVVRFSQGDVITADARVLESHMCLVNESALTGESLPVEKRVSDTLYAGTTLLGGSVEARIKRTGSQTRFGSSLSLLEHAKKRSALEEDILRITGALSAVSVTVIAVLGFYILTTGKPFAELVTSGVALLIAGIPVGLPTVMTIIISLGVLKLAKNGAVVRRLASLEDLANVNVLLSDKTGTLTEGSIQVTEIVPFADMEQEMLLRFAHTTVADELRDLLSIALKNGGYSVGMPSGCEVEEVVPGDSTRKRATSYLRMQDGASRVVSVGAAQVIATLLKKEEEKEHVSEVTESYAREGKRVLVVAMGEGKQEADLSLAGFVALTDPLRGDAEQVIAQLRSEGVHTKLVSGDSVPVVSAISKQLDLSGRVVTGGELRDYSWDKGEWRDFRGAAGFAEVLPEDKLHLVELAQKSNTVASTGDGANDLAAIRAADVGIAVANAVSALKQSADIVLSQKGITVINTAIISAREIFERVYTYSMYRISESVRVIITIAFLTAMTGAFPLSPLQLILLAVFNDVPIISLAFNRVVASAKPAHIRPRERMISSSLYGLFGVIHSVLFFLLFTYLGYPEAIVSTLFFLKLVLSGHLLIFVVHTPKLWWTWLPSAPVVASVVLTQGLASLCAFMGWFMNPVPFSLILFTWLWSLVWMQGLVLIKWFLKKNTTILATA